MGGGGGCLRARVSQRAPGARTHARTCATLWVRVSKTAQKSPRRRRPDWVCRLSAAVSACPTSADVRTRAPITFRHTAAAAVTHRIACVRASRQASVMVSGGVGVSISRAQWTSSTRLRSALVPALSFRLHVQFKITSTNARTRTRTVRHINTHTRTNSETCVKKHTSAF